ncbi:E3 ubiquitin-protein ligase ZSWIM2 [Cheilinus undulatus]|uniref:E3 ubiquitin-protein ligase ZSWIM2 n=1 Tax=Cheilinus undulatus TaxID=241271 RepID=UPI001BD4B9C6|nr:E3 ubiquitin-protein ligase ZSWIM2 [Cheilinus undulatus]XP_041637626.1 E3 ubiquitin-protein ligase ZSWIM2 [Cheilinus undulatus]
MFRKTAWRKTATDAVSLHQDQALNTTIFLLKSFGPTRFLLREDRGDQNFKVCLGDRHTCTCPVFTREQEPCKHICWVLLRKFRLPREHEYSFQPGLVERQISEVLRGLHQTKAHQMENDPRTPSRPIPHREAGSMSRKVIHTQDVCPICLEKLLEKKLPVCHCRFGCGKNVHISCMKVWADHQRLSDKVSDKEETVKCPLCRGEFSSLMTLQAQVKEAGKLFTAAEREKPERHLGVQCNSCLICPVIGKCFKCTVCRYFYLCEGCVRKGCHKQHLFATRKKRGEKWHLLEEDLSDDPKGATSGVEKDYIPVAADPLPEKILACLPTITVRPRSWLLFEGLQCRICLQEFNLNNCIRTLPCHHKFHSDCVDRILLKTNCCPLDGFVIYNPLTWRSSEKKTPDKSTSHLSSGCAEAAENNLKDLFIPGVALRNWNTKSPPTHDAPNLEVLANASETLNTQQEVTSKGKSELRRKLTPENNNCSTHKTKQSPTSSNKNPAMTDIRDQLQLSLFVGLHRPESDNIASSPGQTRPQPRRKDKANVKEANREVSDLRMTGVVINTPQQRNTET